MALFSWRRRRRTPYQAATDEERIARYVYLLNSLPASVIESAHASAFRDVPLARRREMFEQLRPFMAASEQQRAPEDPAMLAALIRRAQERHALRGEAAGSSTRASAPTAVSDARDDVDVRGLIASTGVLALVAQNFLISHAVMSYYTVGAGSLVLASEPAWVADYYDTAATGFDGGMGGGFDGGAFGSGGFDIGAAGGFDGGGFGG